MRAGALSQLPTLPPIAFLQFDRKRITFYYTAVGYIDFRQLLVSLYALFLQRVWFVKVEQ